MSELFESILEMNKQMLLNGFDAQYILTLSKDDFHKLASYMTIKFKNAIVIKPESDYKNWTEFKVAGPGGYITIKREI